MSPDGEIPLEHLSDRELILLTANKVNTLASDHEKRIRFLERMAYGLAGVWFLLAGWLKVHILGGK